MQINIYNISKGIDIWKQFLNRWDLRVCLFLGLYVFCGLIISFCYLVASNEFNDSDLITIGIGYLFATICSILFLVLRLLIVFKPNMMQNKSLSNKIEIILIVFVFIFILLTSIAYCSLAGDQVHSEIISYYVGCSLFQIIIGIFMTFDITFCQYLIPILC